MLKKRRKMNWGGEEHESIEGANYERYVGVRS